MAIAILRIMRAIVPAVIVLFAAGLSWSAHAGGETRTLSFYNIHTKEKETITYKRDDKFIPEGLKRINHMMRDWRRDEPTEMDPVLIDTIWAIYQDLGSKEPIHLVSGYRSKKTNESLRRRGGGQARFSQHILGKAADIHLPDIDVKKLRNSALVREVGGVGYYPKSGLPFVHVDTGRVRHWPRIPRQELAMLFPEGKTKHRPSDGRPLTKRDGERAMAKLDKKIDDFITRKSKIKLPKMMMAGFTPSWPKADPVTTASLPRDPQPVPRAAVEEMAAAPDPAPSPAQRQAPAPAKPQIAIATIEEPEHPEELTSEVSPELLLLREEEIDTERLLAQLTAPGKDEDGYLLRDPEPGYSSAIARGLGYTHELKLVAFGATPGEGKRRLRTASR